jgi:hypothetical protein
MSAVMNATVTKLGAMPKDEYERQRTEIEERYPAKGASLAALRDQALADLFYRSGWTQEQLAAKEGKTQQWVAYRLRFGRFLHFTTSSCNSGKAPLKLTEGKFRSLWDRTEKGDERVRFREVARMLEEDMILSLTHAKKPKIGHAIMDQFADGGWHKIETIFKHVEAPEIDVRNVLKNMERKGTYGSHCESRKSGRSFQYRIVKGGSKKIDVAALEKEMRPLLQALETEGKKNMATMSPSTVLHLAHSIKKLMEKMAT